MRDAGTTPNGVFGSKLMWAYLDELLVRLRELGDSASPRSVIERHFANPRFVWIWREDVTAQAVSWAKAIQTGRWHHWNASDPSAVLVYDREQIEALADEVVESNARWRNWFAANEIQPLAVRFEDLVADKIALTCEVLEFLGLASECVAVAERTIKTSDHTNEEWLGRYRAQALEGRLG